VKPPRLALRTAVGCAAFGAVLALLPGLDRPDPAERAGSGSAASSSPQAIPAVVLEPMPGPLPNITVVTHAGDDRLFIVGQRGQIWIVEDGAVRTTPFLDIGTLIVCCGEQGLLGLAFHPDYEENGFFFVNYTELDGDTVIARYRVRTDDPNRADPFSGVPLLNFDQPFVNHNGGELQFGPDGYLYIATGDGGSGNDPMCNAQRDDTLLGKILRLDVDQNVDTPPYHGIPSSNPFAGAGDPADKFWVKGLRNPWRFSFDRVTRDLYIGDVGQGEIEEIDFQPAGSPGGENYGWKMMEGPSCGGGATGNCPAGTVSCNDPSLVPPILWYDHSLGCSVTGGYVYRGGRIPNLYGSYIYGDYCSGRLWSGTKTGDRWTATLLTPRIAGLTTFGQGLDGELYVGTQSAGLFRLVTTEVFVPTASSVSPSSGSTRGGTLLAVHGSNFVAGGTVTVGGVPAFYAVGNPATLFITAPAHPPGAVNIVITNPGGPSVTLAGKFTYVAPVPAPSPRPTPRIISPRG
jgi:glucose/arabinose dehydrogenase